MTDRGPGLFDAVSLDSFVEHECSPVFDTFTTEERGIRINAPEVIEASFDQERRMVSPSTRFPVCIAMQFPLRLMVKFPEPRPLITLVIVNRVTGESFSANLAYSRDTDPLPRNELPKEVVEKAAQRLYYNVNLCHYLRLPAVPATYVLYATFQEYKSNVMNVRLVEKR